MAHELTFVSLMHVFTSLGRLPRRRFGPMIEGTRLKTFKFSNWILFCFSMWKKSIKIIFNTVFFFNSLFFILRKFFFRKECRFSGKKRSRNSVNGDGTPTRNMKAS